jgi:hypothetical protein
MRPGDMVLCWRCGSSVRVRADGLLPKHATTKGGTCKASGRVPYRPQSKS